ncbi:MAG: Pr6Pr family membrane protein, partial [Eubacterium sp.]
LKKEGLHGSTNPMLRFKGAITMMITVTFLIYHFLLAPRAFSMNSDYNFWAPANLLVHYFTPLMVILDWLIFDKKNAYRPYDPLLWLAIPLLYLIFILIRAQLGGPITAAGSYYPYFFLDVDVLSWIGVLKWVLLIAVFFALLGYIIYFIDKITFSNGRFHFGHSSE